MNWKKIDEVWNEYATISNLEVLYNERNLFHAIECKYQIHEETSYGKVMITSLFWKSQEGTNHNKTKINVRFLKNSENTLYLEPTLFSQVNLKTTNTLKKSIHSKFKQLNGKVLKMNNNRVYLELNKVISSKFDFELTHQLLNELNAYR